MTVKIMPVTYSGAEVEVMDATDNPQPRSSPHPREHADDQRSGHHDDHHPEHQPAGQPQPLRDHFGHRLARRPAVAHVALHRADDPFTVSREERPLVAFLFEPCVDLFVGHAHVALGLGDLFEVARQVDHVENDQRQDQDGQEHCAQTLQYEHQHGCPPCRSSDASEVFRVLKCSAGATRCPRMSRSDTQLSSQYRSANWNWAWCIS